MLKARVHRHKRKKSHWVVDPPGFDTRRHCGGRVPIGPVHRREMQWYMNGGRVIKGYEEALEHANCLFKESRWRSYGERAGMVCGHPM